MTDPNSLYGPVEQATRDLIVAMGTLSTWQAVTAQQAIRLAALADDELDGSKAAALSREMRQVLARLAPEGATGPTDPKAAPEDGVAVIRDQLAAKRAAKAAGP